MKNDTRKMKYVGLDVHAETISIAVADGESRQAARSVATIPNEITKLSKALGKLGRPEQLLVCYEAGPTGFELHRKLSQKGIYCEVIAPTLVPVRSGDRVKTDARDARKLAQSYRAGELTPIYVPSGQQEALRDLVRTRQAAKKDETRAKHRITQFLLRHARTRDKSKGAWGQSHLSWLRKQRWDEQLTEQAYQDLLNELQHHMDRVKRLSRALEAAVEQVSERYQSLIKAVQSLRGVALLTAITIISEVGTFHRFATARQFMSFLGLVPSEHSSGGSRKQGGITKTGNAHIRRCLGQSAFSCRLQPRRSAQLRKRQEGLSQTIIDMSWEAQKRLNKKFHRMVSGGKSHQVTLIATARELAGFIWAIGIQQEREFEVALQSIGDRRHIAESVC